MTKSAWSYEYHLTINLCRDYVLGMKRPTRKQIEGKLSRFRAIRDRLDHFNHVQAAGRINRMEKYLEEGDLPSFTLAAVEFDLLFGDNTPRCHDVGA